MDFSQCPQISSYCKKIVDNGNSSGKVDVVFLANNYTEDELDAFATDVNNFIDKEAAHHGLFSVEPFKSYQDKFNFYFIEKVYNFDFENSTYTGLVTKVVRKECPDMDELVVVLNYQLSGGRIIGFANPHVSVVTRKESLNLREFTYERSFLHEFGHAFGNLNDEYTKPGQTSRLDRANCDVAGCPKWCSGRINSSNACYGLVTKFDDCVDSGNSSESCWDRFGASEQRNITSCDVGIDCVSGTACVWNCGGTNGYKPSYVGYWGDVIIPSIMLDGSLDEFDPVSRRHLEDLLKNFQ